ncbi:MAG: relaxase/mobilization nuclease domain-containing protein [Yoonia sp.]
MIISFFATGTGGGAAPVGYLIAGEVLAYDENRNLIRDDTGQPETKIRDPLPEVLHGNPDCTRDLIDPSQNKWTYTAGVISFTERDVPSGDAQQEAIEQFEALAFAGLERDQYDCLWVRHVHEGNVELHFCAPRLELSTGKALNIAPPGHEAAFATLRDQLNKTHNWADPMEPDRAREFKIVRESAERAEARAVIVGAIYDQIDAGLVTDRPTMLEFLEDAGFEITRRAEKSISIRDPEFQKPFKLERGLTHEYWTAARHAEIASEYETGADAERTRRLDGIPHDQLCRELAGHVDRRATYNRERFGRDGDAHALSDRTTHTMDAPTPADRAMGITDGEFNRGGRVDRDQPDMGLADTTHGDGGFWFESGDDERPNLSDLGSQPDPHSQLHDSKQANHLPEGAELDGDPDSIGTRIARIRGAVGDGLRSLSDGITRLGSALNGGDRKQGEWLGALRGAVDEITSHVSRHIGRHAARGAELRDASRGLTGQLEVSETRRGAAERELDERELERGHSHSL